MNIFPGGGFPPQAPFKSNPETLANTKALNLRNEQFVIGQANRDKRIADRTARQDARQLTQQQRLANTAQNENADFQPIENPAATSSALDKAPKRRGTRNIRRGRGK